ncbi:MAG: glycosyltransferase [Rhodovulum sp.]
MTGKPLRVSVIVPTYRDWKALAGCLSCLAAQTLSRQDFEILIGNNNPEEPAPEGFDLPPNARLVWQPKPGSYAARNAAARSARGAVLAFTDSDCRPEPDWLQNALALLDAAAYVDRIGGVVILEPNGAEWTLPELYDRVFGLRQERYVRRGYAATANLIVRRDLFERVGPFEESLYSSGDKEWNRRAQALGSRIVLGTDVRVRHPARMTFEALKKKRLRIAGGRFRTKGKHEKRLWIPSPKYLFPALSALRRIAREPGLTGHQVLRLWAMDYALRRAELRELIAIRQSHGQTRRQ